MARFYDADKVDEAFNDWLTDLTTNAGDRRVADVLSSVAVQAMFLGDIDQFARADLEHTHDEEEVHVVNGAWVKRERPLYAGSWRST